MNYEKKYIELIESRKNRRSISDEYYEKHHIGPKSLAINKEEEKLLNQDGNIVRLTYKEHFIAHQLLYKMTKGDDKKKMGHALWCMCRVNKNQERKITAGQYEIARKSFIESCSDENSHMYGKKQSQETKEKMSKSRKGLKQSKETKEKISKSLKNKDKTNTHKEKISESCKKGHENMPNKEYNEWYENTFTKERNRKLSESKKGKKCPGNEKTNKDPEKIRKTAEKHRGMKRSEETRKRISDSRKGKSPGNKGKKYYHNPETLKGGLFNSDDIPEGGVRGYVKKNDN